jgi:hypothetical protein
MHMAEPLVVLFTEHLVIVLVVAVMAEPDRLSCWDGYSRCLLNPRGRIPGCFHPMARDTQCLKIGEIIASAISQLFDVVNIIPRFIKRFSFERTCVIWDRSSTLEPLTSSYSFLLGIRNVAQHWYNNTVSIKA